MSLTPNNELAIRRAIAEKLAVVPNIGIVLPEPMYFAEKPDFWATVAPKETRNELERTTVKMCAIYPLKFEDSVKGGGMDEPLIYFTYELYFFHEKNSQRLDESETAPDAFNKKLLKSHSDFVAAWLEARGSFLGKQNLTALDDEIFAVRETTALRQDEFIDNNAECEFIPGVKGFEVRMQLIAKILLREC